jgi:hypothetical protein
MNRIALGIAFVTALAACGGDAESREDLDSQALADSAAAATSRTAPAATPRAAPAQPVRAIQAGTTLTFEVRENVSTSSHDAGDTFSLVLVDAVTGAAGASLPAGAAARGVVTGSHSSTGPNDESILGIRVGSVEAAGSQRPISGEAQSADVVSSTRDSGTRTAATIATGAAAVGTAVGVGVALTTRGGHAELPVGSRIVVRLSQDLVY